VASKEGIIKIAQANCKSKLIRPNKLFPDKKMTLKMPTSKYTASCILRLPIGSPPANPRPTMGRVEDQKRWLAIITEVLDLISDEDDELDELDEIMQ
jgi:hypothetical protein